MSEEATKKYYGKREIREIKGEAGKEDCILVLDDGKEVSVTGRAFLACVTDQPLEADLTGVRDLVTKEVVKLWVDALVEYGVRMIDVQNVMSVFALVLNEMENQADNKAYGFDRKYELTVRKVNELINS